MKQFWIQFIALTAVILLGFWLTTNPQTFRQFLNLSSPSSSQPSNQIFPAQSSTKKLVITSSTGVSKAPVTAEVADTAEKRAQGLGGRDKLEPNAGMLFIFEKPTTPQFWMKGLKFPLDIIWIRGDSVVGSSENLPPPVGTEALPIYSPAVEVDKVLEVNAGFVKNYGIVAGDKFKEVQ